jgi:hypothetical protein
LAIVDQLATHLADYDREHWYAQGNGKTDLLMHPGASDRFIRQDRNANVRF